MSALNERLPEGFAPPGVAAMLNLVHRHPAARVPGAQRVISMDSSDASQEKKCSTCGAGWRFPLLLGLVLAALLLARSGWIRNGEEVVGNSPLDTAGRVPTGETVSLTVDFGDGQPRHFDAVPWSVGMTIEDVLGAVSQMPDGPEFAKRGSGPSAFLTRIGEMANEGAEGRNWTYQVNDQRGDRSFAVYELAPGDRVLWRYGPQE